VGRAGRAAGRVIIRPGDRPLVSLTPDQLGRVIQEGRWCCRPCRFSSITGAC